jgi:hypothetical protein
MSNRLKSPYQRFALGIATTAAATLALTACSDGSSSFNPEHATYSEDGNNVVGLLDKLYAAKQVRACKGVAGLLINGHVRFDPDSSSDNRISGFTGKTNVVITDPYRIEVYNGGDSNNWYIASLVNGQLAFVNGNALVAEDKLVCDTVATQQTPPGPIALK